MIKSDASPYHNSTTGTRSDAAHDTDSSVKVSRMSLIYTNTNIDVGLYNAVVFGALHVGLV